MRMAGKKSRKILYTHIHVQLHCIYVYMHIIVYGAGYTITTLQEGIRLLSSFSLFRPPPPLSLPLSLSCSLAFYCLFIFGLTDLYTNFKVLCSSSYDLPQYFSVCLTLNGTLPFVL